MCYTRVTMCDNMSKKYVIFSRKAVHVMIDKNNVFFLVCMFRKKYILLRLFNIVILYVHLFHTSSVCIHNFSEDTSYAMKQKASSSTSSTVYLLSTDMGQCVYESKFIYHNIIDNPSNNIALKPAVNELKRMVTASYSKATYALIYCKKRIRGVSAQRQS